MPITMWHHQEDTMVRYMNWESLRNVHSSILETGFDTQQLWSDYYIQDASFLKMDNILWVILLRT